MKKRLPFGKTNRETPSSIPAGLERKIATVLICVAALMFAAPQDVPAKPYGGDILFTGQNAAKEGCLCHAPYPNANVTLSLTVINLTTDRIEPLPETYEPSMTYLLRIFFQGGPSEGKTPENGTALGGFALQVTKGELGIPKDEDGVQVFQVDTEDGGSQWVGTHTSAGNQRREWHLEWTAPPVRGEVVTFYLSVNSVNGDGTSQGDGWSHTVSISRNVRPDTDTGSENYGDNASFGPELRSYWVGLISLGALALILVMVLVVLKTLQPRRRM